MCSPRVCVGSLWVLRLHPTAWTHGSSVTAWTHGSLVTLPTEVRMCVWDCSLAATTGDSPNSAGRVLKVLFYLETTRLIMKAIYKWQRWPCFHQGAPVLNAQLAYVRKSWVPFPRNGKQREMATVQAELHISHHHFVTEMTTRWGSCQKMIERVTEPKKAIPQILKSW